MTISLDPGASQKITLHKSICFIVKIAVDNQENLFLTEVCIMNNSSKLDINLTKELERWLRG